MATVFVVSTAVARMQEVSKMVNGKILEVTVAEVLLSAPHRVNVATCPSWWRC